MKIQINGYDVEIKAKDIFLDERYNEEASMNVINQIVIWARLASEKYDLDGCRALSNGSKRQSEKMVKALEDAGFYKRGKSEC